MCSRELRQPATFRAEIAISSFVTFAGEPRGCATCNYSPQSVNVETDTETTTEAKFCETDSRWLMAVDLPITVRHATNLGLSPQAQTKT